MDSGDTIPAHLLHLIVESSSNAENTGPYRKSIAELQARSIMASDGAAHSFISASNLIADAYLKASDEITKAYVASGEEIRKATLGLRNATWVLVGATVVLGLVTWLKGS